MKLLNIGIDNTILNQNSNSAKRMLWYSSVLDYFSVVVPNKVDKEIFLSKNLKVIGVGGANKVIRLFRMYKKLNQILQKEKFDLISCQDPFETAFLAWLLSKKYKIPLNIQEHGDFFSTKYWRNESLRNFYRYYLGLFLLKQADSIRVVSKRQKKYLTKKLKISEEKITAVPVYTESNIQEKAKRNDDKFVFLWMGRFVKQKNLELLVKAFAKVSQRCDKAILRLVGRGEEKKKIIHLVEKLNLANRVEFLDWVDDVYREYNRADAYVLSSNYEGWGRVIVEALQAKLPIIMTNVGCAGEVLKNKESGLVVPVGNEKVFAFAMEELYNNKSLRNKFIKNSDKALTVLKNKEETLDLYLKTWKIAIKK